MPTAVVPVKDFARREDFETALAAELASSGAELVALAGFMRILSPEFVHGHAGRLLNIHPSLLPKYKGLDTHARALADRETHHGASVHYVTAGTHAATVVDAQYVSDTAEDALSRYAAMGFAKPPGDESCGATNGAIFV